MAAELAALEAELAGLQREQAGASSEKSRAQARIRGLEDGARPLRLAWAARACLPCLPGCPPRCGRRPPPSPTTAALAHHRRRPQSWPTRGVSWTCCASAPRATPPPWRRRRTSCAASRWPSATATASWARAPRSWARRCRWAAGCGGLGVAGSGQPGAGSGGRKARVVWLRGRVECWGPRWSCCLMRHGSSTSPHLASPHCCTGRTDRRGPHSAGSRPGALSGAGAAGGGAAGAAGQGARRGCRCCWAWCCWGLRLGPRAARHVLPACRASPPRLPLCLPALASLPACLPARRRPPRARAPWPPSCPRCWCGSAPSCSASWRGWPAAG